MLNLWELRLRDFETARILSPEKMPPSMSCLANRKRLLISVFSTHSVKIQPFQFYVKSIWLILESLKNAILTASEALIFHFGPILAILSAKINQKEKFRTSKSCQYV